MMTIYPGASSVSTILKTATSGQTTHSWTTCPRKRCRMKMLIIHAQILPLALNADNPANHATTKTTMINPVLPTRNPSNNKRENLIGTARRVSKENNKGIQWMRWITIIKARAQASNKPTRVYVQLLKVISLWPAV